MKDILRKIYKYLAIAFLILALAWLYSVLRQKPQTTYTDKELRSVEVRDYQGEDLSSVNSFRENSIKGPQYVDKENYRLQIRGLKDGEKSYAYDQIVGQFPDRQKVVTLDCVEGWSAKILWEGFLLKDLIKREAVAEGKKTIIFRAYDGYSTSFPIDYVFDNDIMIAYKMNGLELPPERGFPFQLVAESKWGYKWIKWITEIEFSEDEDYEGFWEQRGYSNSGDLDKSFLE